MSKHNFIVIIATNYRDGYKIGPDICNQFVNLTAYSKATALEIEVINM
jgi:hypothetical protein